MAWVQERRAAADKSASGLASGVAPHRAGRGICRREPRSANPARSRRVREHDVSSRHLLTWRCVAVELAEQGAAVLLGRLGKLLNEAFDLLASGVFEGFGTAEIDSIGFHQFGIEFVLADDLAEPVADLVTSTPIAVSVSVGILGRKLTLIGSPRHRTGIRSDLLDRADTDAVRTKRLAAESHSESTASTWIPRHLLRRASLTSPVCVTNQPFSSWITSPLAKEKLNCLVSSFSAWIRVRLMFG